MGPSTAVISTVNLFFQISVVAEFCSDLVAKKTHFLKFEDWEEHSYSFSKIPANVFPWLDFEMCLRSQLLKCFIEKNLIGQSGS